MPLSLRLALITLLTLALTACEGVDLNRVLGDSAEQNNEDRIAAGLREALRVGAERTVEQTGREDGYLGDSRIRIPLPDQFQSAASQLRRVGLDSQVDELERSMNRAAESAAREAAPVFASVIRNMRPSDVYALLEGDDDAATRFLRDQSETELRERYEPIVRDNMEQAGVYRLYQPLQESFNRLPMLPSLDVDLDRYVTDRALDGLFTVLAQEESRIREDPAARTTELLRDVFGRN